MVEISGLAKIIVGFGLHFPTELGAHSEAHVGDDQKQQEDDAADSGHQSRRDLSLPGGDRGLLLFLLLLLQQFGKLVEAAVLLLQLLSEIAHLLGDMGYVGIGGSDLAADLVELAVVLLGNLVDDFALGVESAGGIAAEAKSRAGNGGLAAGRLGLLLLEEFIHGGRLAVGILQHQHGLRHRCHLLALGLLFIRLFVALIIGDALVPIVLQRDGGRFVFLFPGGGVRLARLRRLVGGRHAAHSAAAVLKSVEIFASADAVIGYEFPGQFGVLGGRLLGGRNFQHHSRFDFVQVAVGEQREILAVDGGDLLVHADLGILGVHRQLMKSHAGFEGHGFNGFVDVVVGRKSIVGKKAQIPLLGPGALRVLPAGALGRIQPSAGNGLTLRGFGLRLHPHAARGADLHAEHFEIAAPFPGVDFDIVAGDGGNVRTGRHQESQKGRLEDS